MELSTERLRLRDLTLADITPLNQIECQPLVTRYMTFDPQSLDETRAYIEAGLRDQQAEPRRVYDLAIIELGRDQLIGRCGIRSDRPEHREALIWYLLHPGSWGRGYAREAVAALLTFGFDTLGLHRIWADCDPRNAASCRLAERLGMKLEGRLRENYLLREEWCDTAVYAMLDYE